MSGAIWIYSGGGLPISGWQIDSVQPSIEFGTPAGQASAVSSAILPKRIESLSLVMYGSEMVTLT
jgi:hypothetical protein